MRKYKFLARCLGKSYFYKSMRQLAKDLIKFGDNFVAIFRITNKYDLSCLTMNDVCATYVNSTLKFIR